jgi:hypothetical protein
MEKKYSCRRRESIQMLYRSLRNWKHEWWASGYSCLGIWPRSRYSNALHSPKIANYLTNLIPRSSKSSMFFGGTHIFTVFRWTLRPAYRCLFLGSAGTFMNLIPISIHLIPCGGGVEYLHRSSASGRRRRKGESRIWDNKIYPRMTALARASSNC